MCLGINRVAGLGAVEGDDPDPVDGLVQDGRHGPTEDPDDDDGYTFF